MKPSVKIGASQDFLLKQALLVYGESDYNGYPPRHPFITLHRVNHANGEAELGPGQLATPSALIELVMGLGFKIPLEILPENVVVRGADSIVWWMPAQTRTMFFNEKNGDAMMRKLNAKKYPQPALLFKVSGASLWVRALAESKRPTADTQLYMAPYWNCYANGVVCLGTMKIPRGKKVEQIYEWEQSFFQSEFVHAAGNTRACKYKGGFLAMWDSLRDKKAFPIEYLTKVRQTLKTFVEKHDSGYSNEFPTED